MQYNKESELYSHPLHGAISKEEVVDAVEDYIFDDFPELTDNPWDFDIILSEKSKEEQIKALKMIESGVKNILKFLCKELCDEKIRKFSTGILLLSSEILSSVRIQSIMKRVLNNPNDISRLFVTYGINHFIVKSILILGYDISKPVFIESLISIEPLEKATERLNNAKDTIASAFPLFRGKNMRSTLSVMDRVLDVLSSPNFKSHEKDSKKHFTEAFDYIFSKLRIHPLNLSYSRQFGCNYQNTYYTISKSDASKLLNTVCLKRVGLESEGFKFRCCGSCKNMLKLYDLYENYLKRTTLYELIYNDAEANEWFSEDKDDLELLESLVFSNL